MRNLNIFKQLIFSNINFTLVRTAKWKSSNRREAMFDEFSKNLSQLLADNPYLNFYICPLCLGNFTRK